MHIQTVATRWDVFVRIGDELRYRWAGEVIEMAISEYRAEMRTGDVVGIYKTKAKAPKVVVPCREVTVDGELVEAEAEALEGGRS